MTTEIFDQALTILEKEARGWDVPIVTLISNRSNDPFQVLVSTMLSLRTKDEVTAAACRRLFVRAATAEEMVTLTKAELIELVYPVGFYKTKAENILKTCRLIIEKHGGRVPGDIDTLLTFPGVGRKTANLVRTLGYGKPGICVDTHVHRITNRRGYVRSSSPDETEKKLRRKLPSEWWIPVNDILVAFGQALCRPISPFCSRCSVAALCEKRGVGRSR